MRVNFFEIKFHDVFLYDKLIITCKVSPHCSESLVSLSAKFNIKNKEQYGSTLSFKRNDKYTYS